MTPKPKASLLFQRVDAPRLDSILERLRPYRLPLAVSFAVAVYCIVSILGRAREPALPLDDSFIHLQYARRLSEGHWFSYVPGDGYSSGATSLIWPLVIAPFFLLGFEELSIIWVVWALGWVLHAAVALEAARLAEGLTERVGAVAVGAMCLSFGAFVWFGFSGMETIALAWVLTRGARLASERCEPPAGRRRPSWSSLAGFAVIAPLVRPEGGLVSLMIAMAGLRSWWSEPPSSWLRRAARVVVPACGPFILPLIHLALSGQPTSSTALVKWAPLDPYLDGAALWQQVLDNTQLLTTNLLNGGPWTWLFVPEGFAYLLAAGLPALVVAAWRRQRGWRALFVAMVLAGTLVPCTYTTMLWNRVRYIWPFAAAWFVVVACLASELGCLAARLRPWLQVLRPAMLWAIVALVAVKLPSAVADLSQSARAIALQQVALGRWANTELESGAVIGVNDTGAIAYLSEKRTFDVVGLTTLGEARYWVEGPGSRFEHYEHLGPERLPSHFIVYPGWMQMPMLLGPRLMEATVTEQSILGGRTMVAYRARYDLLSSGALPVTGGPWGELQDELDVSDMESEQRHDYGRGDLPGRFNVAGLDWLPAGRGVADGGRLERLEDRFVLQASPAVRMVMRVRCSGPLEVWLGGERIGEPEVVGTLSSWDERAIVLPSFASPTIVVVRPTEPVRFASYHYWWFAQ
ncbi:MAG: hypothetical protein JRI68_31495 [Deltaproteobacteria bacterium]|nr:hypothetical protein [Deltaproteobacteria bacterium]